MRSNIFPAAAFLTAICLIAQLHGPSALAAEEPPRQDLYGDPLPAGALARLGTVRSRLTGFIPIAFGFLPDGQTIVAVTEAGPIRLFEAGTGRLVREISPGSIYARTFAWSANGKYFALGGSRHEEGKPLWDSALRILDATTGKEVRNFLREGDHEVPCALALTPDGKYVFSLGSRGNLRIEEVASGAELLTHKFPGDTGACVDISSDGAIVAVATGLNSNKLFVWQWQTGAEPREINIPQYAARFIRLSPDGSLLAGSNDRDATTRVWEVASGKLVRTLVPRKDLNQVGRPAFTPDSKTLATTAHGNSGAGSRDGTALLWDVATGTLQREIRMSGFRGGQIDISADGTKFAALEFKRFCVWDLRTGNELSAGREGHNRDIDEVALSGTGLAMTASEDHTVRLWDAVTGRQLHVLRHGAWVRAAALSPDGSLLVSSSLDDTVRLWDTRTGREIFKLPGHGSLGGRRTVAFAPDGKTFLSWGDDLYLRIWDVKTGKAVAEHAVHPENVKLPDKNAADADPRLMYLVGGALITPDGLSLLLRAAGGFQVFDTATGKFAKWFPTESIRSFKATISADSKLLVASGYGGPFKPVFHDGKRVLAEHDHLVCWWQLPSGKLRQSLTLAKGSFGAVAVSPDGRQLAVGVLKPAPRICFYEIATGKLRWSLEGVPSYVRALAYSPDGKRLIAALDDTTALVWDLKK